MNFSSASSRDTVTLLLESVSPARLSAAFAPSPWTLPVHSLVNKGQPVLAPWIHRLASEVCVRWFFPIFSTPHSSWQPRRGPVPAAMNDQPVLAVLLCVSSACTSTPCSGASPSTCGACARRDLCSAIDSPGGALVRIHGLDSATHWAVQASRKNCQFANYHPRAKYCGKERIACKCTASEAQYMQRGSNNEVWNKRGRTGASQRLLLHATTISTIGQAKLFSTSSRI